MLRMNAGALTRWTMLPLSVLLLLACARSIGATQQARSDEPLNFIVIVADDHRWDSLGCAGNAVIKTPHLDALAADGVRFEQARVTTSICMTSRASILTGQTMSRHGIDRFGVALSPDAFAQTYAGKLREAGYWSGFVGKYGVGGPRKQDFDFLRAYERAHWHERDGERVHVTELNARDSLEFLRQRPRDKPFVLSLSFFAPHAEDRAREQYLPQDWSEALYEGVAIPPSPLAGEEYLDALPPFIRSDENEGRMRWRKRFDTPQRYQTYMTNYYRLITEVDAAIGRIVAELKEQGVYDNTMIVFIGDNGYFHGDRGLADKWYPYEEALRVPLIVYDPRLPAARRGMVRDEWTLNIDVAPTVLAAAGLGVPAAMQGQDVAPLYLSPRPPQWRDRFYYEHPMVISAQRIPASQALVRHDWKYIYYPDHDYEQLFDMKNDPAELHNLADDPEKAELLKSLRAEFKQMQAAAK